MRTVWETETFQEERVKAAEPPSKESRTWRARRAFRGCSLLHILPPRVLSCSEMVTRKELTEARLQVRKARVNLGGGGSLGFSCGE